MSRISKLAREIKLITYTLNYNRNRNLPSRNGKKFHWLKIVERNQTYFRGFNLPNGLN